MSTETNKRTNQIKNNQCKYIYIYIYMCVCVCVCVCVFKNIETYMYICIIKTR